MSVKKKAQKPARSTATTSTKKAKSFTDVERAAMKERVKELKAETRGADRAEGERAVLEKIAEMKGADRAMATRIYAIIKASAPDLAPKTWYGMPAWARDGKVVCFFQSGQKFKARYATFGFSDEAKLDDDTMWPTSFALKELTPTGEARIIGLLKKATG